jgi:hypothetical protein
MLSYDPKRRTAFEVRASILGRDPITIAMGTDDKVGDLIRLIETEEVQQRLRPILRLPPSSHNNGTCLLQEGESSSTRKEEDEAKPEPQDENLLEERQTAHTGPARHLVVLPRPLISLQPPSEGYLPDPDVTVGSLNLTAEVIPPPYECN